MGTDEKSDAGGATENGLNVSAAASSSTIVGQHSNKTKPTPVKVEKTWTCTAKDCGRTDLTEEEKKSHKTKEGTQCSNQNKGPDNGYTVTRSRRRLAADVPCKDCNRLCNPSEQCQSQQCRQLRIALRRS